jgi:hypothetical protein
MKNSGEYIFFLKYVAEGVILSGKRTGFGRGSGKRFAPKKQPQTVIAGIFQVK